MLLPAAPNVTIANAFMIEMVCTFLFVMINLVFKIGKTSPSNDCFLSCLAVALTLLAMICVSGSKTGACLNPAVGIAQTVFELIQYGNQIPVAAYAGKSFTDYLGMYICAPLVGATMAGLAHIGHQYCHDRFEAPVSTASKMVQE